MKALHQLPHYALDRPVIAYQTYVGGFKAIMTRKKRIAWPKLPQQVGSYNIESMKHSVAKTEIFVI